MKRSNGGGSRTGGTGDIKPQIMTISTGLSSAPDDYVTNQVQLPVPRFGMQKNVATIFELLWVDWFLAIEDISDVTATHWAFLSSALLRTDAETATLVTWGEDAIEPRTFAMAAFRRDLTTSGATAFVYPIHINLTDNNGNGFLVATDRLVATMGTVGNTGACQSVAKIGYRLVNVGVQEYVGIVQAQQ